MPKRDACAKLEPSSAVSSCAPCTLLPGGAPQPAASAGLADLPAFSADAGHQVVPRRDEGGGPFVLQPGGQHVDVDSRLGEASRYRLAVASVRWEDLADLAMVPERLECGLRHRV